MLLNSNVYLFCLAKECIIEFTVSSINCNLNKGERFDHDLFDFYLLFIYIDNKLKTVVLQTKWISVFLSIFLRFIKAFVLNKFIRIRMTTLWYRISSCKSTFISYNLLLFFL